MRLILHHVIKDLRAQRRLVAAWLAALASACVIEALELDVHFAAPAGAGGGSASLACVLSLLALARVVLAWVLAIRFVHADPTEGADAFWLTRPLSRGGLLLAKGVLIVGLLLVVPGLAAAFVFLMNGLPAAEVPWAVAHFMLIDAIFVLPLVLLAALTRDLARLVLAVLLGAGGWALVGLTTALRLASPEEAFPGARLSWLVLTSCLVVACAVLTSCQYLRRRTAKTAVAGGVMLAVLASATVFWPVRAAIEQADPRGRRAPEPEWTGASGVSIEVPSDTVRVQTTPRFHQGRPDTLQLVLADVRTAGLAADVVVDVGTGQGALWLDGQEVPIQHPDVYARGPGGAAGDLSDAASRSHFERAIGARLLKPAVRDWEPGLRLLAIDSGADYAAIRGKAGVYRVTLPLTALRVGRPVSIPLKAGAGAELGGIERTILSVGPWSDKKVYATYAVTLRVASPRAWMRQGPARVEYLLLNRRSGEAIVVPHGVDGRTIPMLAASFVVSAGAEAVLFASGSAGRVSRAWLDDAELVMVPLESLGAFRRTITIPNFALPAASPLAGGGH
jgi:hypothetical protein